MKLLISYKRITAKLQEQARLDDEDDPLGILQKIKINHTQK